MSAINVICSTINILAKSASVADAGIAAYTLSKKKENLTATEKAALIANAVFAFAQVFDLSIYGSHSLGLIEASGNFRLALNCTSGTLDVTRVALIKCSRKRNWDSSDTLDILGIALYRITDAASTAIQIHQNTLECSGYLEQIETGTLILSTTAQVVSTRRQLRHASNLVWNSLKECWEYITDTQRSVSSEEETQENFLATEELEQQILEDIDNEIQAIINWKTLEEIPASIAPHFPHCKLSGQPIRHIMETNFPHLDRTLVFSKSGITKWINAHPGQTPEWWPSDREFSMNSFREASPFVQHALVDQKLEQLAAIYQINA
jgi:hypothetical protein